MHVRCRKLVNATHGYLIDSRGTIGQVPSYKRSTRRDMAQNMQILPVAHPSQSVRPITMLANRMRTSTLVVSILPYFS
jgi:hypothetical protein